MRGGLAEAFACFKSYSILFHSPPIVPLVLFCFLLRSPPRSAEECVFQSSRPPFKCDNRAIHTIYYSFAWREEHTLKSALQYGNPGPLHTARYSNGGTGDVKCGRRREDQS